MENEPSLSPPICNKEVGGMSSWKKLSFNVMNIVLRGKKMEVEMACARETILLPFSSSEVKGTESCEAASGTVNCEQRAELWIDLSPILGS